MKKLIILFTAALITVHVATGDLNLLYGQRGQGGGAINSNRGIAQQNRGGVNRGPSESRNEARRGKPADMTLARALEGDTQLASRLELLLPDGMSLSDAASGFKNQGQFIATLHVSQNLEIPFDELKLRMTAEEDPMSLGQAIQDWDPEMTEAEVTVVVSTAETQAAETQTGETPVEGAEK